MKNRLKELRNKRGLTLDDIERATDIKRGTFNNYENGITEPKFDIWTKLADFFKVPVSYLQGEGWSQDEVIQFLALILINMDSQITSPSGEELFGDDIGKYGNIDDEELYDLNEKNPLLGKIAKEYLIDYKKLEIEKLPDYDKDFEDLRTYVEANFDDLVSSSLLTTDDKRLIANDFFKVSSDSIDLYHLLTTVLPEKTIKLFFDLRITIEFKNISVRNTQELETTFSKETKSELRNALLSEFDFISDYTFLSHIGENGQKTGVIPEYEIAKEIQNEVDVKDLQRVQDYLSVNPYKVSKELIDNINLPEDDKKSLFNIVNFLMDSIYDLEDKVKYLSHKVSSLEKPDSDFED